MFDSILFLYSDHPWLRYLISESILLRILAFRQSGWHLVMLVATGIASVLGKWW